jgi:hypothetical protein
MTTLSDGGSAKIERHIDRHRDSHFGRRFFWISRAERHIMDQDQEHLRLLSLSHYIMGGIIGLFSCFPIVHVIAGVAILNGAFPKIPDQPELPPAAGWIFIGGGVCVIVVGWILAIAVLLVGRLLAKRKAYIVCLVVAAIECLFIPFGTVLGVLTIIVLMRPSVKQLFEQQSVSQA